MGMMANKNGFTLVEVIVTLAVMSTLLALAGTALTSQSNAVDANMQSLVAEAQCDRAMLTLFEDLQTTNTTDRDSLGNPYCVAQEATEESSATITFRCVEGFDIDQNADTVVSRYGPQVSYFRNARDQLIRTQNNDTRVVANNIAECEFSIATNGSVDFRIVSYAGDGEDRVQVAHRMSVKPRNGSE